MTTRFTVGDQVFVREYYDVPEMGEITMLVPAKVKAVYPPRPGASQPFLYGLEVYGVRWRYDFCLAEGDIAVGPDSIEQNYRHRLRE